ncbi:hypothetical protein PENTCL1PPCAC_4288, partial [Pristionchus entomophagus]
MFTSWFIFSLLPVAHGICGDWRHEDELNHGCRSCREISVDYFAKCPEKGFACDERQSIRATVLNASDACTCQSLRCANKGWRLAVNGTIVDKVQCKRGQWLWSGFVATSIVCAMPTDAGIPATPRVCPALPAAPLDECDAYQPPRKCSKATLVEPVVSCPGALVYVNTEMGEFGVDSIKCDTARCGNSRPEMILFPMEWRVLLRH